MHEGPEERLTLVIVAQYLGAIVSFSLGFAILYWDPFNKIPLNTGIMLDKIQAAGGNMRKQSGWLFRFGVITLVFTTLACNLTLGSEIRDGEVEQSQEVEAESQAEAESEDLESDMDDSTGGMDLAPCPVKVGAMILKFSAVIKIEAGEASLTHTLDDGILNLWVEDGPGPAYAVRSLEPAPIPYQVTGTMGECTLSGEGTMTPDAYGTCEAGVVQLTIVEDWGQAQGTATCGDQTQDFPMPGIGRMEHTGADGNGELFYLDRGFSEAGPGMTSIRPFSMGEGEHIWTIFVDPYLVKP
jgi:hypothetical protein